MKRYSLVFLALGLCGAHCAWSQSSCSSDGQTPPATLVEHFISADCETCWSSPPAGKPGSRALSIDWIAPGTQGDDAPLAVAASRDALLRLGELGISAPATSASTTTMVRGSHAIHLRVAQGLRVGAYIGATIELRTSAKARLHKPLNAWLLLVETIPAGVEGTPVERNLVRNVLTLTWSQPDQVSATGQSVYRELRALNIPEDARPQRLRLVGWVQDADGRLLSVAQSVCAAPWMP